MFIAARKSPRSSQTPSATRSKPIAPTLPRVPWIWKVGMAVLVVCLVASIAIAIVKLSTTPEEILGDGFHGLPVHERR